MKRALVALALFFAALVPAAAQKLPPIRHVFVIVLENQDYAVIFGPDTPTPYLGKTLPTMGALLPNYYATGHASLDNYISMISGQPPNPETQSDCPTFTQFKLKQPVGADGIAAGSGCLYPRDVKTIAGQMDTKGLSWRGYMEDMGDDPAREPASCAQPAVGGKGAPAAAVTDMYAYRHNPFVYFRGITDRKAYCQSHDVNLDALWRDLVSARTTPNYSFIVPNVCNDGHDYHYAGKTCVDGEPGGLPAVDAWLRIFVPRILSSPAFRKDGLLVITFDESGDDSTACCGEPSGPNTGKPGGNGPGGGRIGAVMLSPFIKGGTVFNGSIDHYGLLRGVEDIFGLKHLGYADQASAGSFAGVFTSAP